jgi:hypothetical protein
MTRMFPLWLALLTACGELHLDAFARTEDRAVPVPSAPLLIDDFEDQDEICAASDGYWYQTTDGTGTADFDLEPVTDRPGSSFAIHAFGGAFTAWGSLLGVDVAGSASRFDVTGYQSLRFWARASAASTRTLKVSLLENNIHYQTDIELGEVWSEYVLPFRSAKVPDGAPPFDPAALWALQFFVLNTAEHTAEPFDFWLDDLTFTPEVPAN